MMGIPAWSSSASRRLALLAAILVAACAQDAPQQQAQVPATGDLPDVQYYGYKIVHHVGATIQHIQQFGFNEFDHPPIANHTFFVITPALDHFYSKAVADLRSGPVVINTPPKDDRYSSLEVFDLEHHATFDKVLDAAGERFVLAHVDYEGELPEGQVIRSNSLFPYVFVRTQSFAFNDDREADRLRRLVSIEGETGDIDLPDPEDTQAVIAWTIANSVSYPQTVDLMAEAAATYTPERHAETLQDLQQFVRAGGVSGNVGMFEAVDDPDGGTHKVRAAGTMLGHLGFPVHHAYYQQIPVDRSLTPLSGANGPFTVTLPYDPGVDLFWSVTRYGADTFLPLDPATLGGHDIQAYNAFNTEPDANGNVTFLGFPVHHAYYQQIPVETEGGYYLILRYYGPTARLNGNTANDILYAGTAREARFPTVRF